MSKPLLLTLAASGIVLSLLGGALILQEPTLFASPALVGAPAFEPTDLPQSGPGVALPSARWVATRFLTGRIPLPEPAPIVELEPEPDPEPEESGPAIERAEYLDFVGRSVGTDGIAVFFLRDSRTGRVHRVGPENDGSYVLQEIQGEQMFLVRRSDGATVVVEVQE